MTVFISYNRKDEEFVTKLSSALVRHNVPVWRDIWQLNVGDSITSSVQEALEKASFVCLVLSKNALESKWVEREINASLVRELEEKSLSILPLIIDDCKLPLFLRDKLYADFRSDFDSGVKLVLNSVADKYNLFAGQTTNDGKITSFGTDVLKQQNSVVINLDVISEDDDAEYHILSKFEMTGNAKALEQFELYQAEGRAGEFVREIVGVCGKLLNSTEPAVVVGGRKPGRKSFNIDSGEGGLGFSVNVTAKKIGPDNGRYVAFNLGVLLRFYESTR